MRAPHLATGDWGEDLAATWYREHGYQVLDRNWRCAAGEIDLVAARDELVVIVEVKTRRTNKYGPAASAVHPAKQRRLRGLAVESAARPGGTRRASAFRRRRHHRR